MKRIIALLALFCGMVPSNAEAGCAVRCNHVIPAEFVPVQYATAIGVPVAQPYPATYTYTPQQPVNVTVNINADDIANKVVQRLAASDQPPSPLPGPPAPPSAEPTEAQIQAMSKSIDNHQPPPPGWHSIPKAGIPGLSPPSAVVQNCTRCHSPGSKFPQAFARYDLTDMNKLTCQQKLDCIDAIVNERMPKDGKMDADGAGKTITEFSKKR